MSDTVRTKGQIAVGPEEAMRLIEQPGVVTRVVELSMGSFFDGDIRLAFDLPDGRTLHYYAYRESDYYGGSYNMVEWSIRTP